MINIRLFVSALFCCLISGAFTSSVLSDGSKLVVGDIVAVAVDGEQELSKPYQVNDQGFVTIPMVGSVKVLGMSTTEASAEITKALVNVLVSPQVSVAFMERAKMQVFVVGQVRKPGPHDVGIGDTVIQALAQAGYDDTADLSGVSVRRGESSISVDLQKYLSGTDLAVNIKLASGDTIVVPRSDMIGTVWVLGQVNKTGSVPIKKGMTFREILGLIGGVTVEADTSKVTIKRTGLSEPIAVNYEQAMSGDPVADLALQPGDTIHIPQLETSFYTVMGGVVKPGQYPLKGKLSVSEAIGAAGGPVPNVGDIRKIQIVRPGTENVKGETVNVDLRSLNASGKPEPVVNRGDVVYVGSAKEKMGFMDIIRTLMPLGWLLR